MNTALPTVEDDPIDNSTLFSQFDSIVDSLALFRGQITTIQHQIKHLEKNVKKELKQLNKQVVKNKNKGNRKPSGFAKPTKVTDELCEFMNRTQGSEIARTDVTKALIEYIRTNGLQYKDNNQVIIPDEKLKVLLGINEGDEVTYFNIQKYMNKHFKGNQGSL